MNEQQRWDQFGGTAISIRFADGPLHVIVSPGYGVEQRIDKAAVGVDEYTFDSPMGEGSKLMFKLIVREGGGFLRKPTESTYDLRQYEKVRQGRRVFAFVPKDDAPQSILAVAFEVTSSERVAALRSVLERWLPIEEMQE